MKCFRSGQWSWKNYFLTRKKLLRKDFFLTSGNFSSNHKNPIEILYHPSDQRIFHRIYHRIINVYGMVFTTYALLLIIMKSSDMSVYDLLQSYPHQFPWNLIGKFRGNFWDRFNRNLIDSKIMINYWVYLKTKARHNG